MRVITTLRIFSLRSCTVILALTPLFNNADAVDVDGITETISEAVLDYHRGDLKVAVSKLRTAYENHKEQLDLAYARIVLMNLLDICIGSFDWDCQTKYTPELGIT